MSLGDRWEGNPNRLAVILPGSGYGPDLPVLYWTAKALNVTGFTVRRVRWKDTGHESSGWSDPTHIVESAVSSVLAEERSPAEVLLVGKSLGSLAIPFAARHGMRGIWLTPLIAEGAASGIRDYLGALPPSLLVGGTADAAWDGTIANKTNHHVCEIDNGDHALEIPGDPVASIEALRLLVSAVQSYVTT